MEKEVTRGWRTPKLIAADVVKQVLAECIQSGTFQGVKVFDVVHKALQEMLGEAAEVCRRGDIWEFPNKEDKQRPERDEEAATREGCAVALEALRDENTLVL